ncbi:hypothetical protein BIW11_03812, partial [Tropilaelaps mercedesae]
MQTVEREGADLHPSGSEVQNSYNCILYDHFTMNRIDLLRVLSGRTPSVTVLIRSEPLRRREVFSTLSFKWRYGSWTSFTRFWHRLDLGVAATNREAACVNIAPSRPRAAIANLTAAATEKKNHVISIYTKFRKIPPITHTNATSRPRFNASNCAKLVRRLLFQPGVFSLSRGFGQLPQLEQPYLQKRSDREDTRQVDAKFIRPFPFRRPMFIRRPAMPQHAPHYAVPGAGALSPYGALATRPVVFRRPLRPMRPVRPVAFRPFLRPMIGPMSRPVYIRPNAPVAANRPNAVYTRPQGKPQRLPDIELRQQSNPKSSQTQREQIQRNLEEIKKPLLKILNSGAKIALHR